MGAVPVVLLNPGHQILSPLFRTRVGVRVRPLAQDRLYESLCFAAGPRGIGANPTMFQSQAATERLEPPRHVRRTIVG